MAVINVLVSLTWYGWLANEERPWWKIGARNKWRVGEQCQHITNIRNGLVFS